MHILDAAAAVDDREPIGFGTREGEEGCVDARMVIGCTSADSVANAAIALCKTSRHRLRGRIDDDCQIGQ